MKKKNYSGLQGIPYLTFYGNNGKDFSGFQPCMFCRNDNGEFNGWQGFGAIFNSAKELSGFQFGIANRVKNDVYGFQGGPLAGLYNHIDNKLIGLQGGLGINYTNTIDSGAQLGLYNQTGQAGISFAIQFGGINIADDASKGTQIGIFNYSKNQAAFQLGVLNIAWKNPIPILPIVNFDF